jgi:riboflavin synthase
MFTGIVESMGKIAKVEKEGSNVHFTLESELAKEAYIDQSIAHNGACLTVVSMDKHQYTVTAIQETLDKTNLGDWKVGDFVNLERSMTAEKRLDGHFVQGHVDQTTECLSVEDVNGSWNFRFALPKDDRALVVSKGSICINGVSLTVVDPDETSFGVSIIPYTYEHTNFKHIKVGTKVNLEFDILGKYVTKYIHLYV